MTTIRAKPLEPLICRSGNLMVPIAPQLIGSNFSKKYKYLEFLAIVARDLLVAVVTSHLAEGSRINDANREIYRFSLNSPHYQES